MILSKLWVIPLLEELLEMLYIKRNTVASFVSPLPNPTYPFARRSTKRKKAIVEVAN
jgi:hypothetical protein